MKIYMVRDKRTGRFYKRLSGVSSNWVDQEEASVWTTPTGPHACLGTISQTNRRMARYGPHTSVTRKSWSSPSRPSRPSRSDSSAATTGKGFTWTASWWRKATICV